MSQIVILLGLCSGMLEVRDDRTVVQAIVTAHEANRVALDTSGDIRFTFSDGLLPGGVDFRERELAKLARTEYSTAPGRYLFDRPHRLYEHTVPLEEQARQIIHTGPGEAKSPIFSFRALTDGRTVLYDTVGSSEDDQSLIHTPWLVDNINQFFDSVNLPLDLGYPEPRNFSIDKVGQEWLDGQGDWELRSIDTTAALDGRNVVELTFHWGELTLIFWVDLERGAIPLRTRIEGEDRTLKSQLAYNDLRWVGERGWMPFQMFQFYPNDADTPNRPGDGIRYFAFTITDADFERTPPREEFAFEFPGIITITNTSTIVAYPSRKVWGLDDISRAAAARGVKWQTTEEPPVPIMPGELAPSTPLWVWLLIAVGLCLLAFWGLQLYRRRHHG